MTEVNCLYFCSWYPEDCTNTRSCNSNNNVSYRCDFRYRKYPTPEQYQEEYGREYPADGAVYVRNSGWGWQPEKYYQAKARLLTVPETQIVCACTPWGKPPDNWKPEE